MLALAMKPRPMEILTKGPSFSKNSMRRVSHDDGARCEERLAMRHAIRDGAGADWAVIASKEHVRKGTATMR